VLSHWFLDLLVHTPDLPLWSDASTKLGFGLWNNAIATYGLEAILLVVNIFKLFGPMQGDSKLVLTIVALSSYFLFAIIAFWLDTKRS